MNIHEIRQKIKSAGKSGRGLDGLILVGIIVVMGVIAFCLGRLSVSPEDRDTPYVKIIVPNQNLLVPSEAK